MEINFVSVDYFTMKLKMRKEFDKLTIKHCTRENNKKKSVTDIREYIKKKQQMKLKQEQRKITEKL